MILLKVFNPIQSKSGQFQANSIQAGSKVLVINKSYVDLKFTFSNGYTLSVIANDRREITFTDISTQSSPIPLTVNWVQLNIDYPQTVNQLGNIVYVEQYDPWEEVTESYPQTIVREQVPTLIPYNIGYGASQIGLTNARNVTIFPSSYVGLAVAPPLSISPINGLGFDHFYAYQNPVNTNMLDLPGVYMSSTGKTGNDATPSNINLMSSVAGPFSLAGLAPIDTATQLNQAYWSLASAIPWASSTNGFLIEAWVNTTLGGNTQFILADDNAVSHAKGVEIVINADGTVSALIAFVGGLGNVRSDSVKVNDGNWHQIFVQYTGITTNTLSIGIDGITLTTITVSGAPVNTTVIPAIGSRGLDHATTFVGSLAYIGMLLSGPGTGQGSPAARFEHAQQSLNTDYQNTWLSRVDFFVETLNAAVPDGAKITIENLYNYAGLLYATTPANTDILHIYNPQLVSSLLILPAQQIGQLTTYQFDYKNPLSHPNDTFITVVTTGFVNADQRLFVNVQGFNMLGLA